MILELLRWHVLVGMALLAIALHGKFVFNSWPHAIVTCLAYLFFWPLPLLLRIWKRR